jgi:hypothetical protein
MFKSVFIQDEIFTADPQTISFGNPETPLTVLYQYHQVTLTSLTAGETLTFVLQH